MKLDHLRYFAVTADSQSISEAARKLNLTQPSLSSSLASLEEELGIPLFQRTHRGIHITNQGEKALHYAKSILSIYENMLDEFKKNLLMYETFICPC